MKGGKEVTMYLWVCVLLNVKVGLKFFNWKE